MFESLMLAVWLDALHKRLIPFYLTHGRPWCSRYETVGIAARLGVIPEIVVTEPRAKLDAIWVLSRALALPAHQD